MKAEISQDGLEGKLDGFARITITLDSNDPPFADGDTIAIGFALDGINTKYLMRKGGNNEATAPEPLMLATRPEISGNTCVFMLQPDYVNMLHQSIGTLILLGKDGKKKASDERFDTYEVVPSALENTGALADYLENTQATPPQEPDKVDFNALRAQQEAEQSAKNTAENLNSPDELSSPGIEETQDNSGINAAAPEAGTSQDLVLAPASTAKSSRGGVIAALLLIALAVIGGGYYYMQNQRAAQEAAEMAAKEEAAKKAAEEAAKAEAEKKAAEEAAKAEAEKKAAEEAAKAEAEKKAAEEAAKAEAEKKAAEEAAAWAASAPLRVREFFAGQRSPKAAMQLAAELDKKTTEQKDAVFRLYYYAAAEGDLAAIKSFAECIDPMKPAWGTVKKDAAEAWQYYGKLPDGKAAQDALLQWTREEAAAGNTSARKWLGEME